MQWLPDSESYFGDPKSKLPDFSHTIRLVETCPRRDDYAMIDRQALTIRFLLKRSWTPYIIFYFAPTAAFTFFGWALNFILKHHPKSMLKIILTLTTLQAGMASRLPNVNYLTFFSYWSLCCILPIYTMVWQWTSSTFFRNMDEARLANRVSNAFMYLIPTGSLIFFTVYWGLVVGLTSDMAAAATPACT